MPISRRFFCRTILATGLIVESVPALSKTKSQTHPRSTASPIDKEGKYWEMGGWVLTKEELASLEESIDVV